MTLLALLVSTDDNACEILGRIVPAFGIAVERFSDLPTAMDRLQQQRFDALIVDFEEPSSADSILQESARLSSTSHPITIGLVADPAKTRDILNSGSHFILYKPLSEDKARAGLRAAAALLNRERRRAHRVPVQAPVELTHPDSRKVEGILIDLSQTGMEVLTAEPQDRGALLNFRFQLPDAGFEVQAHGEVAWADRNGETGVRFLDLEESIKVQMQEWLRAAVVALGEQADETVPHCKLTDLSLGGCYVESDSPFPEHSMVDLCLRTEDMAVHTDGMVRVTHPGHGMGLEFPSRTAEQRAQVENLINFLRSAPESMLELIVSPRALTADLTQFERPAEMAEEMDDPLLDLLRRASRLQQDDFLSELRCQRSGESVEA
ncbi:MAG TPA: PilZ domain-containing protein [Candidatus Aquilonibacter sp.]|nr:PilZ domain-containing protein [Candidatus Aquilonibacter sp.]